MWNVYTIMMSQKISILCGIKLLYLLPVGGGSTPGTSRVLPVTLEEDCVFVLFVLIQIHN